MGLGKGTERKGAQKSRDQRSRKNSSMEAEKKGCDSPRLSHPRVADCIWPLRAQFRVTYKCDPKEVLAASKGTTSAFQTHNRAPD